MTIYGEGRAGDGGGGVLRPHAHTHTSQFPCTLTPTALRHMTNEASFLLFYSFPFIKLTVYGAATLKRKM